MGSVVHITEAEAARDFAAVMRHVRAGDEVVVEDSAGPVAVLKTANSADSDTATAIHGSTMRRGTRLVERTVDQARALLEGRASEGYTSADDPDFARDMEAVRGIYNAPMDEAKWA